MKVSLLDSQSATLQRDFNPSIALAFVPLFLLFDFYLEPTDDATKIDFFFWHICLFQKHGKVAHSTSIFWQLQEALNEALNRRRYEKQIQWENSFHKMDEERMSASSNDSDHENDNDNEGDEVMEDVDEGGDNENENDNDNDNEGEDDNNNDDDEEEDGDQDGGSGNTKANDKGKAPATAESESEHVRKQSATPRPTSSSGLGAPWMPKPRPEALNARLYDIVPTMAAPQATSINTMAITPDMRYWLTGGSDGYIRKYDGPGTINGKLALTVAQKHPFVDSVTKAGILMSYWENEEPAPPGRGEQEHGLSPVYALAIQSDALWLLSGLESGGINLQSVRHDEGKRIACLQQHSNAVSVLTLAQDEKSVLSGGWDKNIFDWDLNTGQVKRSFDGSGGQISALEVRPANGAPIPQDTGADEPRASTTTMSTNNAAPPAPTASFSNSHEDVAIGEDSQMDDKADGKAAGKAKGGDEAGASPAHESLFGGSDAGSLFGEDAAAGQPFGHDEDEFGTGMHAMSGHEHEGGMDHSADMAMASLESKDVGQPESVTDSMDVDLVPTQGDEPSSKPAQAASSPSAAEREALKRSESPPATAAAVASTSESAAAPAAAPPAPLPPTTVHDTGPTHHDPSQTSATTFFSASMDGTLRLWDRRIQAPVARIVPSKGVPPWCMGACWSPDGNRIYAGRRNGTVEEYDVRQARRGWEPRRTLKFPAGSGAVSAVKPMVNGRHLVW